MSFYYPVAELKEKAEKQLKFGFVVLAFQSSGSAGFDSFVGLPDTSVFS